MIQILRKLVRSDRGATAIEYGLIIALVVLGMMIGLTNFANATIGMWNNVSTSAGNVM